MRNFKTACLFVLITIILNMTGFVIMHNYGFWSWKDFGSTITCPLTFLFPVYLMFLVDTNRIIFFAAGFLFLSYLLHYNTNSMSQGDFTDAFVTGMFQLCWVFLELVRKHLSDDRIFIVSFVFVQTFGTFLLSRMIVNRLEKRSA